MSRSCCNLIAKKFLNNLKVEAQTLQLPPDSAALQIARFQEKLFRADYNKLLWVWQGQSGKPCCRGVRKGVMYMGYVGWSKKVKSLEVQTNQVKVKILKYPNTLQFSDGKDKVTLSAQYWLVEFCKKLGNFLHFNYFTSDRSKIWFFKKLSLYDIH